MTLSANVVQKLRKLLGDDSVICEGKALSRYCRDQSIYSISPGAVVLPRTVEEISHVIKFAREAQIPITPRGGGSSTAGGCLGRGIVIAFPRENSLANIGNFKEENGRAFVTAGAGAIHSNMQDYLAQRGYFLPADPSSAKICRIGGNVATKASGPHALRHGSIDKYLKSLVFVMSDGTIVDTADEKTMPKKILQAVADLARQVRDDRKVSQRLQSRRNRKIASGYNLFSLLDDAPLSELVAHLLVGSVGTLGVITEATFHADPLEEGCATLLLSFSSLSQAGEAVLAIKELDVAAIEIMNAKSVEVVCQKRRMAPDILQMSGHVLLVEITGPDYLETLAKVEKLVKDCDWKLTDKPAKATSVEEQKQLWTTRKALLPTFMHFSESLKALSVVNDVGVPPKHLAPFISDVERIFEKHGLVGAIYGHAGNGNLHLRPLFDVTSPNLLKQLESLVNDVYEVLFN